MDMTKQIEVEVAYATPSKQLIKSLTVPEGTTAMEAVKLSGIENDFDALDITSAKMGIFSKAFSPKLGPEVYQLTEGDRVEIYRPLIADPKEARRKRAAKKTGEA